MSCPHLKEVVMLFCAAYPVKKMVPLDRLATANPRTLQPHVVPVWFWWDGTSLWISAFSSTRKVKELLERRHARLDGYGRFTDTKADSKSDKR